MSVNWKRFAASSFTGVCGLIVNQVAAQYGHDWKIYGCAFLMGIAGVCYGHVT